WLPDYEERGVYVGLRGGRRRSFGASSSKITATCRRRTALKSSENLTTMVKQCRELFCPSARKSLPADRPRKGLNHPLLRSNIAGAVGIASLSWPCMYLGFLAMYRGMKSIKPYNSKLLFPAHLLKCTCWCQSRVKRLDDYLDRLEEQTGLKANRGMIARRALELFLATHQAAAPPSAHARRHAGTA